MDQTSSQRGAKTGATYNPTCLGKVTPFGVAFSLGLSDALKHSRPIHKVNPALWAGLCVEGVLSFGGAVIARHLDRVS
jgi:hypothetical protein